MIIKSFNTIGRYVQLMRQTFTKPDNTKIFWRQLPLEIEKLGVNTVGIIVLISIFMGVIMTMQTIMNTNNPMLPRYTAGFVLRDTLMLEFSSTIMSLLLAGKVGSNIASEIGTMRITEQIDALDIMGVNSANYLILPKIIGMMISMPFLVSLSVFCGLLGGCGVALFTDMITISDFIYGIQYVFIPYYFTYSIIKSFFFGFIIASISAFYGYNAYGGALDVGRASTNAVVNSSVMTLAVNVMLTKLLLT